VKVLPHTRSCFVCGEANPSGLKLRFETDGRIVRTRFIPKPEHIGFKQTVHGGLIATLLDEIMVWACAVRTRRFAFCAELNVRFRNVMRPNEEVTAVGELVANRREKLFEARAEVKNPLGQVLAAASGKYLPINDDAVTDMATDFVEDPAWVFRPPAGA
jgi:acyl-coenzyme A thioesterase PaaI-like protein